MKDNKTIIIIISAAALIIIAFLFYNQHTLRQENLMMRELLSQKGGDKNKETDPYISGPVKNRIIKGSGELKACYKEYLAKNKGEKKGEIKIDWQIDTDGCVIDPEVVFSQFPDASLGKCITEKISKWKFPEPAVKKYLSHLFRFDDVEGKEDKNNQKK